MSTEPLTLEETLAMAVAMSEQASKDANAAEDQARAHFWDGWASGLETLLQHQRTGVKATCFPMGSCACHAVKVRTK